MEQTNDGIAPLLADEAPIDSGPLPDGSNQTHSVPVLTHSPSILLLDDDPHMLELQARMLQSLGYPRVTRTSSAKEALLQLEHDSSSANVIICDLGMPDMDGIEFLQILSASGFRGSAILLSGEGMRIMHSVQKLLGGSQLTILGALAKPAGRDELRHLLEGWKPRTGLTPVSLRHEFLSHELRAAIHEQQWVLHYQPQVCLRTGALVGVEALVRWNHPVHGLVYPDRFIGLAEDCGAIDELTDWVVAAAMRQRAVWQAEGLNVKMAVNVSMESLRAPGFWRRFSAIVNHLGTSPHDVTLEVTESRIVSSSSVPLENLVRLRLLRFTLSIDDFGTGHSSLAQLRDVPFTELKIDRGFVHSARNDQVIRPILEGSVGIAKLMKMKSVAEGVETESDWHLLRELECDMAQGYFIGRPMAAERIWIWLNEWQGRLAALVGT